MLFYKLTLLATITSCLLLPPANEVWGKVMFSQVFVRPQGFVVKMGGKWWKGVWWKGVGVWWRGLCGEEGCVVKGGGARHPLDPEADPPGTQRQTPPWKRRPLKRAVCIPLECILVGIFFQIDNAALTMCWNNPLIISLSNCVLILDNDHSTFNDCLVFWTYALFCTG